MFQKNAIGKVAAAEATLKTLDGHPLGVIVTKVAAADEKDGNEYCPSTICYKL